MKKEKKFFRCAACGTVVPVGTVRPCQNSARVHGSRSETLKIRHGRACEHGVPVLPRKSGFSTFPEFPVPPSSPNLL